MKKLINSFSVVLFIFLSFITETNAVTTTYFGGYKELVQEPQIGIISIKCMTDQSKKCMTIIEKENGGFSLIPGDKLSFWVHIDDSVNEGIGIKNAIYHDNPIPHDFNSGLNCTLDENSIEYHDYDLWLEASCDN